MIIACDFDGTIAIPECYPDIGQPNMPLIRKLRKCHKAGDKIIIWTCRTGQRIEEMKGWLGFFNVPFDYVNENDPERTAMYANDSRKVGADVYVDDRAMTPEEWVAGEATG
jgi:hypothetical protein